MLRLCLGTYNREDADKIIKRYNEQRDRFKERSGLRVNGHIVQRGRGSRKLYIKNGSEFTPICSSRHKDIPINYATNVALYLVLPDVENIQKGV